MSILRSLLTVMFCAGTVISQAQTADSNTPKPDNTKMNKGDQKPGAVTADRQKANAADIALTRKIRRSIIADKSLSIDAHNIKVISQNGTVTLKGPVLSDEEKKLILAKAVAATGDSDKVSDQISVKQ